MLVRLAIFSFASFFLFSCAAEDPCARVIPNSVSAPAQGPVDDLRGVRRIEGDLVIHGVAGAVTTLEPLACLEEVDGDLLLEDTKIRSLEGLGSLRTVGGSVEISANDLLTSLEGLGSLEETGSFLVFENPQLIAVTGPPRVRRVRGDLAAASVFGLPVQRIDGFDALIEVDGAVGICNTEIIAGFPALERIGGTFQCAYSNVRELAGLTALTSVGGDFVVTNSAIERMEGLGSLQTIGGTLELFQNESAAWPLPRLQSIGGDLLVTSNLGLVRVDLPELGVIEGQLLFESNRALVDLDGLAGLRRVGGRLYIGFNESLADASGLLGMTSLGGPFEITGNPMLPDCDAKAVWCVLVAAGYEGAADFTGNADNGCGGFICP